MKVVTPRASLPISPHMLVLIWSPFVPIPIRRMDRPTIGRVEQLVRLRVRQGGRQESFDANPSIVLGLTELHRHVGRVRV